MTHLRWRTCVVVAGGLALVLASGLLEPAGPRLAALAAALALSGLLGWWLVLRPARRGQLAELRRLHDLLSQQQRLAMLGQLAAGTAHEVKNPLTGVIGLLQIMRLRAGQDSALQPLLLEAETAAIRSRDIANNFLRFARMDAQESLPIHPNALVHEATKLFNHHLQINQIKLELHLDENVPDVLVRVRQLQQVIVNLVLNAQQAMPEGGTITIATAGQAEREATITVSDDGPGVPLAIQGRIFEPLFTTKQERGGTGMGLALCKLIVEEHRGRLALRSTPGAGASFVITLPAAPEE